MVALDGHAGDREAFDDIGVDGALRQPLDAVEFLGFAVEDVDESLADDFAFLFGVGYAFESLVEVLFGVHSYHVEAHVGGVAAQHVLELVVAQQAVVHEDAGEVFADGAVKEHGGHGGIHAAGEGEHHLVVAEFLAQLAYGAFNEGIGGPVLARAADVFHEVGEDDHSVFAVIDFGVELEAPGLLAIDAEGGVAHVGGGTYVVEAVGGVGDGVAVAHPHHGVVAYSVHQRVAVVVAYKQRFAVFACVGRFHFTAGLRGEVLRAVAYAEQGIAAAQLREVYLARLGIVDRERAAGDDDADNVPAVSRKFVEGHDFAISVELAHAPRYELCVLRTAVQYDYSFQYYEVYGLADLSPKLFRLIYEGELI